MSQGSVPSLVRMTEPLDEARLRRLLEIGGQVTARLDVETVLQRVLEAARDLTGARYAALGILDQDKRELERFVTVGIDEGTHQEIGDLPRGRGILGLLIQEPLPLRLHDVVQHPRSYGFPPGHPQMHSFLGVPIRIRGEAFGNLYLTDKAGGDFDEADESAVVVLAEWAGIAIDNARLYQQAEGRRRELERAVAGLAATVAISQALGAETDLGRVLELIVKRGRALVDARALVILLQEDRELVVAATAGDLRAGVRGQRIPLAGTVAERVIHSGHAERIDDVPDRMAPVTRRIGLSATTALVAPLIYRGRAMGVLQAYDRTVDGPDFTAEDARLLESFATSAAIAVVTAQSVLRDRLEESIEASEQERRRWARDLHDETLQGLGALRLLLSTSLRSDEEELRSRVTRAIEQLDVEIDNLRGLVTELRPAALDELGLAAALRSLVERVTAQGDLAAELEVDLRWEAGEQPERLAVDIEETIYRLVQEGLRNVLRHAEASTARIAVCEQDTLVVVTIRDDGQGFDLDAPSRGFGLLGMRERIDLVGGELEVSSEPGEGTTVRARLPNRRSRAATGPPAPSRAGG
jgi:signal transduction histidine kinase